MSLNAGRSVNRAVNGSNVVAPASTSGPVLLSLLYLSLNAYSVLEARFGTSYRLPWLWYGLLWGISVQAPNDPPFAESRYSTTEVRGRYGNLQDSTALLCVGLVSRPDGSSSSSITTVLEGMSTSSAEAPERVTLRSPV